MLTIRYRIYKYRTPPALTFKSESRKAARVAVKFDIEWFCYIKTKNKVRMYKNEMLTFIIF